LFRHNVLAIFYSSLEINLQPKVHVKNGRYLSKCNRTVRLACRCVLGERCMARSEPDEQSTEDQSHEALSCTYSRYPGLSTAKKGARKCEIRFSN